MPYVFLAAAIALEVVGTSLLPATHAFSRLWPSVGCLLSYAGAFAMLSRTVRDIPIGLTYAMWSGLGTALIVAIGVVVLGESISATKLAGVLLVIGGVVLLNLGGAHCPLPDDGTRRRVVRRSSRRHSRSSRRPGWPGRPIARSPNVPGSRSVPRRTTSRRCRPS